MQISIKYVNFPRPGGKYGSIIGQDGFKIRVPPDLLDQFRAGQTVDVNTKEQLWYRGTPQEEVATIATSGPTGPVQGQGGQAGYQRSGQQGSAQRSNTGFQPRVIQGGPPDQQDPAKDLHIFVTGIVQQAMSSGKFSASEIPVLIQATIEGYDRLLDRIKGKPASRQPSATPNYPATPTYPEPPLDEGDPGPEAM